MKIEFYLIDAFEIPHFEPIFFKLKEFGLDCKFIAEHPVYNSAGKWFDYKKAVRILKEKKIRFSRFSSKNADFAFTTQEISVLRKYKKKKVRLNYGVRFSKDDFQIGKNGNFGFDLVLRHGPFLSNLCRNFIDEDKIIHIGYPKMEEDFNDNRSKEEILDEYNINTEKNILLYLPTWDEYSSVSKFSNAINNLRKDYCVITKPHHCTYRLKSKRGEMDIINSISSLVLSPDESMIISKAANLILCDAKSGALTEVAYMNMRNDANLIALDAKGSSEYYFSEINSIGRLVSESEEFEKPVNPIEKIVMDRQLLNSIYGKTDLSALIDKMTLIK